jgi:hypothetical protein
MTNITNALKVRRIFETKDGYSTVSVDTETFNKVRGVTPEYPYTASGTTNGGGVRIFNINGVSLISRYDKEQRKTKFIMDEKEALANLVTLAEQRANGPILNLPF